MSETPEKLVKKTGRKPKEASANDKCRFCKTNLKPGKGKRPSFENLFKLSCREESKKIILANACESIGFKLNQSESLSDRVCQPCGCKIRNTSELCNFIKEAVAQTIAKEKISDNSERSKRQLPITITPDRNEFKKPATNQLQENCFFQP